MTLLYVGYLYNDLVNRNEPSNSAQPFLEKHHWKHFYESCLEFSVPPDTERLLYKLSAKTDPSRPNCQYVPTLAAFLFDHDFGRAFPAALFFRIHDILSQIRQKSDPDSIIKLLMDSPIIDVNGIYTISNYLGDVYY